jgi:hypothetical protein
MFVCVTERTHLSDEYRAAFADTALTARYATELAERLAGAWTASVGTELAGFDELVEKNLAQLDELQVLLDTVRAFVWYRARRDADVPGALGYVFVQIKADQLREAEQLVPALLARTMHLQQLFRQIEQIEVGARFRAHVP